MLKTISAFFGLILAVSAAAAADLPVYGGLPATSVFDHRGWEVRAGGFAHDPTSGEKGSVDLNGEIIAPKFFSSQNATLDLFIPRLGAGFTANFAGKTSQGYADLVWTFELPYRFFVEGQFGGSVNNGKTGTFVPPGHNRVGCNVLFHEAGSIGYRLTDTWSIMGTVEHSSNAGLCSQNRGLTNYGLRLGYSF